MDQVNPELIQPDNPFSTLSQKVESLEAAINELMPIGFCMELTVHHSDGTRRFYREVDMPCIPRHSDAMHLSGVVANIVRGHWIIGPEDGRIAYHVELHSVHQSHKKDLQKITFDLTEDGWTETPS